VDNWGFGRAYEPTTSSTKLATDRIPIYTLPAVVAQEESGGYLRAYVGTGNRAFLRKDKGGECRADDLATCVQAGCNVSAVTDIFNGRTQHKMKFSGSGGNFDLPSVPTSGVVDPAGTAAACTDNYAKVDISVSCGGSMQSFTGNPGATCSGSGSAYACSSTGSLPSKAAYTTRNAAADAAGGSRFTNVAIFGPTVGSDARTRRFDLMDTAAHAASTSASYDSGRVQLSELVDVTGTTSSNGGALGGTKSAATSSSAGWTLNYNHVDERTATSATVLAGCVLWSSVKPTGTSAGGCASAGSVTSFTYQADFITGAPSCAESFKGTTDFARSVSKNVISPPPEPAAAVEISATGAIRYSLLNVQPTYTGADGVPRTGNAGCREDDTVCLNSVRTGTDALQLMYSMPLTSEQHECRHVDATACQ
jgi:type IV pilus assembly protein PilY1